MTKYPPPQRRAEADPCPLCGPVNPCRACGAELTPTGPEFAICEDCGGRLQQRLSRCPGRCGRVVPHPSLCPDCGDCDRCCFCERERVMRAAAAAAE